YGWVCVTFLTIGLSALGAIVGGVWGLLGNADALKAVTFQTAVFKSWMPVLQVRDQDVAAIQPIWPMLFVTIACGAISGWHDLFGSIGKGSYVDREITDMQYVSGRMI